MKITEHGEQVYSQDDLCNLIMQGHDIYKFKDVIVDETVDLETAASILEDIPVFILYDKLATTSKEEFDHRCQSNWKMPQEYKDLDIADYVLSLCKSQVELQRCGQELLMFQDRNLFDLLKYLKYLVDTLETNQCIWGVGRGSSVASYVLYKLKVHRIDSLYYDLDASEFLR